MAVAARPGPSDARVPCPLCGGLIHPIAGKCKHCKADLTTYHAVRPAANAPLPALHPAASGNGHANGHVTAPTAYAPIAHAVPVPVAVAAAHDASQPVLPPRPTLRGQTAEPRASGWRSWPVLVIILATLAIVAAVVLMVWPGDRRDLNDKHMIGPPPAPDRMQTAPEIQPLPQVPNQQTPVAPPQNGATRDPWTGQIDPPPQDLSGNPLDKDDKDDIDDASQDPSRIDPFSGQRPPSATPGRRHLQVNGRGMMWLAILTHACRKMIQCGTSDPAVQSACEDVARTPSTPPANCAAAARCLRHIDTMSCGNQIDDLSQLSRLMMQFRDCADATQC